MQRLRLLNRFFFQELGFAGNVNDYYDPRNSYLHCVLETRRGIPITLALLYVELASQIGLHARGVSFPGHFLVKLRMPQGEVVIDPFTGQSMSREALDALLVPYRRREGLERRLRRCRSALFLQAAPPREVIARMLRNLKEIHRSAEDWPRLLPCTSGWSSCCPTPGRSGATAASSHAAAGRGQRRPSPTCRPTSSTCRDAADRFAINERLLELGHGDPSRLH